jgi:RND family efflux transporter MFP subunit
MNPVRPVLVAACACLGLAIGCSSEEPPVEVVRPVISIVVADVASFRESTLPGRAKAAQEANLAFEVPGKLIERPAEVGDRVERGQLLARLDPRDYEAQLLSAQGAYRTAKADYERAEALLAEEAVAENVRDRRRAAFDVSAGRLKQAEKALEDTELLAPFAGTVTATYLENFQNALAKQPVVRLVDTSRIEMEVSVPESLISLAPIAYDVQVEFDAYPGRKIPATVTEIGDEASAATRTYPVTVVMDPPEDIDIKPGMAGKAKARADLPPAAQKIGIEIPLSALFAPADDPEKRSYVWIVDPGALQVSRREVAMQQLTRWGARVGGLKPGERVVTVGVHHLREGQRISLLD